MAQPQAFRMMPVLKKLVPACFVIGAGMETFMIYGRVGKETFYDVAKRKEEERRLERLAEEKKFREEREERRRLPVRRLIRCGEGGDGARRQRAEDGDVHAA